MPLANPYFIDSACYKSSLRLMSHYSFHLKLCMYVFFCHVICQLKITVLQKRQNKFYEEIIKSTAVNMSLQAKTVAYADWNVTLSLNNFISQ